MYRYSVAKSPTDKQGVFALIRKIYGIEGYLTGNGSAFDKYLLLETSMVFRGLVNNKLFGTISVVTDLGHGLPMDILYKKELEALRQQGKLLAEVTQFAVDHDIIKQEDLFFNSLKQLTTDLPLFKLVLDFAAFKNLDFLCITVNPRHAKFYQSLGFVQFGELKYYESVNNAPALLYVLDLHEFKNKKLPGIFKTLSAQPDFSLFT